MLHGTGLVGRRLRPGLASRALVGRIAVFRGFCLGWLRHGLGRLRSCRRLLRSGRIGLGLRRRDRYDGGGRHLRRHFGIRRRIPVLPHAASDLRLAAADFLDAVHGLALGRGHNQRIRQRGFRGISSHFTGSKGHAGLILLFFLLFFALSLGLAPGKLPSLRNDQFIINFRLRLRGRLRIYRRHAIGIDRHPSLGHGRRLHKHAAIGRIDRRFLCRGSRLPPASESGRKHAAIVLLLLKALVLQLLLVFALGALLLNILPPCLPAVAHAFHHLYHVKTGNQQHAGRTDRAQRHRAEHRAQKGPGRPAQHHAQRAAKCSAGAAHVEGSANHVPVSRRFRCGERGLIVILDQVGGKRVLSYAADQIDDTQHRKKQQRKEQKSPLGHTAAGGKCHQHPRPDQHHAHAQAKSAAQALHDALHHGEKRALQPAHHRQERYHAQRDEQDARHRERRQRTRFILGGGFFALCHVCPFLRYLPSCTARSTPSVSA